MMMAHLILAAAVTACITLCTFTPLLVVSAQDPAQGWMGYAVATSPTGSGRITYMEAKWVVGASPRASQAFYSPWFGIESSDNKNLIQPVNPWSGSGWSIYNEYFQWQPEHNENSRQHDVKTGDVLFGSVTFNIAKQSYTIVHTDLTDGWTVSTEIGVQKLGSGYKNYTIAYFVYEKVWPCHVYPQDQVVTFYDIKIEWDNVQRVPKYATAFVDDACNNRASIINSTALKITWDVKGTSIPPLVQTPFGMRK